MIRLGNFQADCNNRTAMSRSLASAAPLATTETYHSARAATRLSALAATFAVLAVAALWIDLPVARLIKLGHVPGDLARLVRLSEAFAYGGTVALFILLAATLDPRGWRVAPRLAIAALGAGLAADAMKLLVLRQRPSAAELSGTIEQTFAGWLPGFEEIHRLQSFPSAHTATAVGLAIALSTLYPRGRWLFATCAVLAAAQRLESHAHFLSDVLAGAAVACLVAAICASRGPLQRWLERLETTS
jgi:membrane-associated phospholipid phosphatase